MYKLISTRSPDLGATLNQQACILDFLMMVLRTKYTAAVASSGGGVSSARVDGRHVQRLLTGSLGRERVLTRPIQAAQPRHAVRSGIAEKALVVLIELRVLASVRYLTSRKYTDHQGTCMFVFVCIFEHIQTT